MFDKLAETIENRNVGTLKTAAQVSISDYRRQGYQVYIIGNHPAMMGNLRRQFRMTV